MGWDIFGLLAKLMPNEQRRKVWLWGEEWLKFTVKSRTAIGKMCKHKEGFSQFSDGYGQCFHRYLPLIQAVPTLNQFSLSVIVLSSPRIFLFAMSEGGGRSERVVHDS